MNDVLISNIARSVEILAFDKPKVPEALIKVDGDGSFCVSGLTGMMGYMAKSACQAVPWFYVEDGIIRSGQEAFFGFYALRNMIRGILLGEMFLNAGEILLDEKCHAPSVSLFYTSAFHLLHSFLALNGRVVVDQVHGPPAVTMHNGDATSMGWQSFGKDREVIMGVHCKSNRWTFEGRPRNHPTRWRELQHVFHCAGVPDCFADFFEYILSYGPDGIDRDDPDFVKLGLDRLVSIRHASLYEGFGYDDYAFDQAINRDGTGYGADNKATCYRSLAFRLLKYCVDSTWNVVRSLPSPASDEIVCLLCSSIYTLPFEVRGQRVRDDAQLHQRYNGFLEWILGQGKPDCTLAEVISRTDAIGTQNRGHQPSR